MTVSKNFCIMPGINAGMLFLEDLERIADLARRYEVPMIKVSGAQRLYFQGLDAERLAELQEELNVPGTPPHLRGKLHYVQACPGKTWCSLAKGHTETMAKALAEMELDGRLPYKVKVGVSGCRACCCESWMRDVGLVAESKGWRLSFGGNAAGRPRIGDLLAEGLSDGDALHLIKKALNYYISHARPNTRTARYVELHGIDGLKRHLFG